MGEGAEGERWVQRGSDGFGGEKNGGEEEGMDGKEGMHQKLKEREKGGSEALWARERSESGWRLWIADVVLWGFGRGRARLNHRLGGTEVRRRSPRRNTQPIKQRAGRVRRERNARNARKPGLQPGEASTSGPWLYAHPNILEVLRQATRKSHGLIHNRKEPRPDELLSGTNSFKGGGGVSLSECISVDVLILIQDTYTQESLGDHLDLFSVLHPMRNSTSVESKEHVNPTDPH